ncbi:hypothetical protein FWD07_00870 [Candidatus Saccharibacteria bacterium]|nr:hypothetical protein [Candidatus Saccharibacteria bacterium]
MSKVKQKIKQVKHKIKQIPRNAIGYKGQAVAVEDYVTGEVFPVVLFVAKNSGLPAVKIVFPTEINESEGVGYAETVTLLKNNSGIWTKNISIEFDRKSRKVVGAQGMVEEVGLGSLDVIVIAQIEEILHEQQTKTTRTPRKVMA